ncbi:MAG: thioredoxin family protein [Rhodospirillales bacterium]|nr:thioredoxin family protein [Rhodospirillales bacterium]
MPGPPQAAGFERLTAAFDGVRTVHITADSMFELDTSPEQIVALLEGPEGIFFRSDHATVSADGKTVAVVVDVLPPFDAEQLEGADLGVTLVTGSANAYRQLVLAAAPASTDGDLTLGVAFLLALLGGLILNLMPCVLPVLGIKIARLIDAAGQDRAVVSASFLATAAGIVASFGLLALLVAAVRAAGLTAGWGFQFQIPGFIAFVAVIVLLFAAVLAGICDIRLPIRVNRWFQAAGGDLKGHAGAFAEGAFATVLATPCTAPVVGTAVGFALTRGFGDIVLVFLGLGLGMAVPWLLVAIRPGLLAMFPPPGPWMGRLKLVLALMLLGTAIWLLSVLHSAAGVIPTAVAAGLSGLAVLAFAARTAERIVPVVRGAGLASLVLAVLFPAMAGYTGPGDRIPASDPLWRPLNPAAVPDLAADQVLLVDVTADWCVTCVVNKRLVLDRPPVRNLLEVGDIVGLRGDWTLPDSDIAAYLATHQRLGVPFNAVYGPGLPEGEVLPELLTADAIIEAVQRAKRAKVR